MFQLRKPYHADEAVEAPNRKPVSTQAAKPDVAGATAAAPSREPKRAARTSHGAGDLAGLQVYESTPFRLELAATGERLLPR